MSERMTIQLANNALMKEIWKHSPSKGLMIHSDRGSQYASGLYLQHEPERQLLGARSSPLGCNAPSESFFHTLKTELVHHRRYLTRQDANQDIFEYIEVFYNSQRRHSANRCH